MFVHVQAHVHCQPYAHTLSLPTPPSSLCVSMCVHNTRFHTFPLSRVCTHSRTLVSRSLSLTHARSRPHHPHSHQASFGISCSGSIKGVTFGCSSSVTFGLTGALARAHCTLSVSLSFSLSLSCSLARALSLSLMLSLSLSLFLSLSLSLCLFCYLSLSLSLSCSLSLLLSLSLALSVCFVLSLSLSLSLSRSISLV
jgi:hypothetical protein